MKLSWYWRRLRRMEATEPMWRARDALLKQLWRARQRHATPRKVGASRVIGHAFVGVLSIPSRGSLPQAATDRLVSAAQRLVEGHWRVFAREHPALGANPDWFLDTRSGRRAPRDHYAFDIPFRHEAKIGNIKYIWEPSRHQHLTVLAAAYAVTGDARYAERAALHLQSWWNENPFLSGPHWISGIELGVRLISWVWVRRLLAAWPKAASLFERNPQFLDQLYHHQYWLASLPSRGSSANNHLIAEAAGQYIASCAFPVFPKSARWRRLAALVLEREIVRQNFASGLNREQATDYHGFVAELFLAAAVEGELSKQALAPIVWERIRAMMDALAATTDARGRPPRQGDGDDGVGLLLDDPNYDRWQALLSTGRKLFGAPPWWPDIDDDDLRTPLWTCAIAPPLLANNRPSARLHHFRDSGQVFLRTGRGHDEIWCRCDHGPHGFLGIAAHAHADALSIEVRVGGVEILADPGTYCYHGDPRWRTYFRSTLAHNTLELLGRAQSIPGGPFLWTEHARTRLISADGLDETLPQARWEAEHAGYKTQAGPVHRRTVVLCRSSRTLTIEDDVLDVGSGKIPARLAFHFGPDVDCELRPGMAHLTWSGGHATLTLPHGLDWTVHRGESDPPLGWFSPSFDVKLPSYSLLGTGAARASFPLVSRLAIRGEGRA
jgi:Heparinase II/III-like protein/Heparinase II/III N-terminus